MRTKMIEDEEQDREVTLGMASLLGIFLGLAVLCGVVFGVGYSMGKRFSPPPQMSAAAPSHSNVKQASTPQEIPAANVEPSSASADETDQAPVPTPQPTVQPAVATLTHSAKKPSAQTVAEAAAPPASGLQANAVPAATGMMVQIAAVSRQEDAQILVSALRQRGYEVNIRREPQDRLLHVQVGPFATRSAAKAMQARLLASGYNAIIKP